MLSRTAFVADGQVVGFSHDRKGQLFGLEPSTGAVVWRGEPRSWAHPALAAGRLAVKDGDHLVVFRVLKH